MRYFLLLLFLGYYGSITLFKHPHIINGVTIVHSHPFNSGTGENSLSHSHTTNGYIIIQLLSDFLFTLVFLSFLIEATKVLLRKFDAQKNDENFSKLNFLYSNGLRAPPFKYTY